MHPIARLSLLAAASTLLVTTAFAAPPRTAPAPSAIQQDRALLMRELGENQQRVQRAVAALDARAQATHDPALREALGAYVEAAKREGQLEFVRIQLRHAQTMGRSAGATELQGLLDRAALEKHAPLPPLPAEAPRPTAAPKLTKAVRP